MMPTPLDIDTLQELYPDLEERRKFFRRALEILREDKLALQDALIGHAYAQAGELTHRLQGTAAFLTGNPDQAASAMSALSRALKQHNLNSTHAAQAEVLRYLTRLESAIDALVKPE